jgi:hypothetical protein
MTRRRRLWSGVALTGIVSLLVVAPAPLASAAVAATASVSPHIQYLDDTAGIAFRFNVRNTGAAGDRIGSVRIARPSAQWTVATCPVAPAGWTSTASVSACTFDSAAGPGDDIAPGTRATFRVKALTLPGSANVTAAWVVKVDPDDAFGVGGNSVTAHPQGGGLRTTIFAWQVLNAVVRVGSPPAAGAPCPPAVRTAPAGSSRVLVICGKNRANVGLTPKAANSSLAGTFIAAAGTFGSGGIGPESASSVVLATYSNTTIASPDGTGKTVTAKIGSDALATSPVRSSPATRCGRDGPSSTSTWPAPARTRARRRSPSPMSGPW